MRLFFNCAWITFLIYQFGFWLIYARIELAKFADFSNVEWRSKKYFAVKNPLTDEKSDNNVFVNKLKVFVSGFYMFSKR